MSFNPFAFKRYLIPILVPVTVFFSILLVTLPTAGAFLDSNRIIALVNKDRVDAGLATVVENSQLTQAAFAKANEMFSHDLFDHFMPDGHTPWDYILATGYDFAFAGENLAVGWLIEDAQHRAWMNSPTHRKNILNPVYEEIGVAVVDGDLEGQLTTLVVQLFGKKFEQPEIELVSYVAKLLGL